MKEDTPARRRPTIRAVAELVRLSATTVSLALRGDDSIPPETRKRVVEAARRLNYVYAPRGRKEPGRSPANLGFVVNDYGDQPVTANPFYGELLSGVAQACERRHAIVSLAVLQHTHDPLARLPNTLRGNLQGILLAGPYPQPLADRVAAETHVPLVLLDNASPCSPYDSVMANDFEGGYAATRHLLELGHRYIIAVTGRWGHATIPPSLTERYRGYCAACRDAALMPFPEAEIQRPWDPQMEADSATFQGWLRALLARSPRPTALFCTADGFAISTVPALQAMGLRVPEDVSVVGFDDLPIASLTSPALTTVQSDRRAMSRIAVERLVARIAGDDGPSLAIRVATRLIVRASSGGA